MQMEPVQQSVNKSALRIRGKAPEELRGPELRRGLQFVYEAFWELDSERSHGFGYSRIPWHCIVNYAAYYLLDDEQTDRLIAHIQAMDLAYIKKLKADSDAKAKR